MCGINGLFQHKKIISNDRLRDIITDMNKCIAHRGPDSEGIYCNALTAIGMRRLSIIDLKNGEQPIWNDDKTKAIVFNGEIYNYKQLKNELIIKGVSFATDSDTEVILKGYEIEEVHFFDKLIGMFAFAIYDEKEQSIIVVRDRAGEKPLYYSFIEGGIIFSSELKSIIASGVVTKDINKTALTQYLHFSYIPTPLTIFEDVYKLQPGHWLKMDAAGNIENGQYWELRYEKEKHINDYMTCKELLRVSIQNAVERCMIADVPVGTFLSGGIDSSIVTSIMAQKSSKPIHTFTIGFKESEYDESKYADILAKKYNTEHHLQIIGYEDALGVLPTIISNMDEPFADQSVIVTHLVSKMAQKHVKAVLTGDGGDELFAGYNRYMIGYYSDLYRRMPLFFRNTMEFFLKKYKANARIARKMRKFVENYNVPLEQQRAYMMCLAFPYMSLDEDDDNSLMPVFQQYRKFMSETDELNCILYADFIISLEGDMLAKVDRAAMLASLETRTPFLDKSVIELAAKIPGKYKLNGRKQKIVLKDAFEDMIPKELINGHKKGFEVPISEWMRKELKADLIKTIQAGYISEFGVVKKNKIEEMLDEHLSGKYDHGMKLWSLYCFEKWYVNFGV